MFCCTINPLMYTYVVFPTALESSDKEWFTLVTSSLNQELTTKLQQLFVAAEQRRQAMGKSCS